MSTFSRGEVFASFESDADILLDFEIGPADRGPAFPLTQLPLLRESASLDFRIDQGSAFAGHSHDCWQSQDVFANVGECDELVHYGFHLSDVEEK